MKVSVIILIFSIYCLKSFSQKIKSDLDTKVYLDLLTELKVDSTTNIYYKTSTKVFQGLNLSSKGFQWYHKSDVENMYVFLNSINTQELHERMLESKIGIHPFIKNINYNSEFNSQPFLIFTPIAYSSDHELALCGIYNWQNNEAFTETLYLLKKKGIYWKIAKFLLLKIS